MLNNYPYSFKISLAASRRVPLTDEFVPWYFWEEKKSHFSIFNVHEIEVAGFSLQADVELIQHAFESKHLHAAVQLRKPVLQKHYSASYCLNDSLQERESNYAGDLCLLKEAVMY